MGAYGSAQWGNRIYTIMCEIRDELALYELAGNLPLTPDNINHPTHYQGNGLDAIQVIESFNLNFSLGNAVKYILRAGKKNDAQEDIKKAIWYLNRELQQHLKKSEHEE